MLGLPEGTMISYESVAAIIVQHTGLALVAAPRRSGVRSRPVVGNQAAARILSTAAP
jgi:hypothetical protein